MEAPPIFNSVEDECRYWKERAKHYHKEWIDAKQEFDEFVEDSRQLEAEMETTLEQKETVVRDLRKQVVQLEKENESLRIKFDSFSIEFANIEKQLTTTQRERDNMKTYLRQLEQKNDDLERAHRILSESIAGFETMLDKAYEKNALLEIEVDEKEVLQEKLQRLMDETRDLKQELNVRVRLPPSPNINGVIDKNLENTTDECLVDTQTQTSVASTSPPITNNADSFRHPDNMLNGNAMTASSRTTALSIVADMLRKLNLDKKLLCSRCDKFRCICERPTSIQSQNQSINQTNSTSTSQSTSRSQSVTSIPSNSSSNNNLIFLQSPSTSSASANTTTTSPTTPTINFGTNLFKRMSQKVSGITTPDENTTTNNAMETKLKAYRDQVPTPRQ